jgi:hypothetical protein
MPYFSKLVRQHRQRAAETSSTAVKALLNAQSGLCSVVLTVGSKLEDDCEALQGAQEVPITPRGRVYYISNPRRGLQSRRRVAHLFLYHYHTLARQESIDKDLPWYEQPSLCCRVYTVLSA